MATTPVDHRCRAEAPGHLRLSSPVFLRCETSDGALVEGRVYRASEITQSSGGCYAHGFSLLRFVQVHPDADGRRMAQHLSRIG